MSKSNGSKAASEIAQSLKELRDKLVGNSDGEVFVMGGMYGQLVRGLVVDGEDGEILIEELISLRPYAVIELNNCTVDFEDGIALLEDLTG